MRRFAGSGNAAASFPGYVAELYARVRKGAQAYPGFLTGHSISIAGAKRGEAKSVMERTFAHMKAGMLEVLQNDPSVPENAFPPTFSKEDFVGFVLDHLLILLVQGAVPTLVGCGGCPTGALQGSRHSFDAISSS